MLDDLHDLFAHANHTLLDCMKKIPARAVRGAPRRDNMSLLRSSSGDTVAVWYFLLLASH